MSTEPVRSLCRLGERNLDHMYDEFTRKLPFVDTLPVNTGQTATDWDCGPGP